MSAWMRPRDTQRRYYVRRFYRDGRRCYEYLGCNPAAIEAAEAAARKWADLQATWEAGRVEQQKLTTTCTPLLALDADLDHLVKAALFASGFHRTDCHWRPRSHAT